MCFRVFVGVVIATGPHLGAFDELLGGGGLVALLPAPGVEGRGLQGAAVGEGQGPGLAQRAGVDGVQVDGRLLLTLAPRQEGHSCRGSRSC